MFLGDFHIHSTFSDGKHSVPELIDAFGTRGFGVIAITDHLCESRTTLGKAAGFLGHTLTPATFPLYKAILRSEAERAWREYQMVVIPGFELTKNTLSNHRSAHLLALGVTEYLPADGDVKDLARQIRALGGVSVAAHPVWTGKLEKQTFHIWDRREELESELDAWEVASGGLLFQKVAESHYRKIASSDLHSLKQISSWKTVFDCDRDPGAILDAIRSGKVRFAYYQDGEELILDDGICDRTDDCCLGNGPGADFCRNMAVSKAV